MNGKKQSHCWWFNSHNTSNCSPWLESTLAELNEKTKMMLKLVEDDADSFAQRAEMYYKKRPELISMVEDFYRAHRSLAERYDQLKSNRSVNIKSPLKHFVCHSKDEHENGLNSIGSVISFDSFTVVGYSSDDESPESEVDDPELDDDSQREKPFSDWSSNSELTKLREELDRLREENAIQKKQINESYQEKEELVNQLTEKVAELKKLREEFDAIKEENAPFEQVKTVMCDVKSLKLYDMHKSEQVNVKRDEEIEFTMQFVAERNTEMIKLWDEIQSLGLERMKQKEIVKQEFLKIEAENRHLKEALGLKESLLEHENEEKIKVMRLFEEAKTELDKMREETQTRNMYIEKLLLKEEQLKCEEKEAKRQLVKTTEELMDLRKETQRKDRWLTEALEEKDEEKRAVIRQLSLAMEILREDNQLLKKAIVIDSSKKTNAFQFQMFKGVQVSNSSSRHNATTV